MAMIGSEKIEDPPQCPFEPVSAAIAVEDGVYSVWLVPVAAFADEGPPRRILFDVSWREGRLPLTFSKSEAAHDDAVLVGNIENLALAERDGVEWVRADIDWDTDELAIEAKRLVDEDRLRGVSIHLAGGTGVEFCRESVGDSPSADEVLAAAAELVDADEFCEEWALAVFDAVIGGAALVLIPAFAEAEVEGAVIAGAQEVADLMSPPREWFSDPKLTAPSGITITADGRVFGHIAYWDSCHRGLPGCTKPPRSSTGYALFHSNAVLTCEDSEPLAVGCLTLDLNHADRRAPARLAADHYDHSGTVFAFVRAGEDEFGVWVAGALAPGLDPAVIEKARRMRLSGDWRPTPQGYELIAAQSVPVPGFVPTSLIADGRQVLVSTVGPGTERDEVSDAIARLTAATEAMTVVLERATPIVDYLADRQLSQALAELEF